MLRRYDEFTEQVESRRWGTSLYKDKKGVDWYIKSSGLPALKEAFSGALFQLFVGEKFSPDVCLVVDPAEDEVMVASKYNHNFCQLM